MSSATLWTKHRGVAHNIATGFYIPGSEQQDVEQEALIGLWEAAREYDPSRNKRFASFAAFIIRRHLTDCLRAATRIKQQTLTDSARDVDMPHLHQVVDLAEDREQLHLILAAIERDLTPWERRCVIGVACGLTYPELGGYRAVDNGLQRARRKLRAAA